MIFLNSWFNKSPYVLGLFVFLGLLSGCFFSSNNASNQVVILANKHQLTTREFAEILSRKLKNLDALSVKDPNILKKTKDEIVKQFVLEALTTDFAEKNNVQVSDDEINHEINQIRSNYPDDLSFRRELAEENLSYSDWKKTVEQSLINRKVFQKISANVKKPTQEEVKKFYESNKDRFRKKERIYLRQIVFDDLTKANLVKEELDKKKSDFASLAKKYSVSPEAKNGGLVGWIENGSVDIFDKAFLLASS